MFLNVEADITCSHVPPMYDVKCVGDKLVMRITTINRSFLPHHHFNQFNLWYYVGALLLNIREKMYVDQNGVNLVDIFFNERCEWIREHSADITSRNPPSWYKSSSIMCRTCWENTVLKSWYAHLEKTHRDTNHFEMNIKASKRKSGIRLFKLSSECVKSWLFCCCFLRY